MSKQVLAPFTILQIRTLELYQKNGPHPFTCCSHDGCERLKQPNEGALLPKKEGMVCPCGKYKQDWVHSFMVDPRVIRATMKLHAKLLEISKSQKDDTKTFPNEGAVQPG